MSENRADMIERVLSWFVPGAAWDIGSAKLLRVNSEYPPPRFVYWPHARGPSALLSEPEARELLAIMILSEPTCQALFEAITVHAPAHMRSHYLNPTALHEDLQRTCPRLIEQSQVKETIEDATSIVIEALEAGHRIEWGYRDMLFDWTIDPATKALIYTQDNGNHTFEQRTPPDKVREHIRSTITLNGSCSKTPALESDERKYVSQAVALLDAGTLRAWIQSRQTT
jgi:hypothetical protein